MSKEANESRKSWNLRSRLKFSAASAVGESNAKSYSRRTCRGSLSFRSPANFACRRYPSEVRSLNRFAPRAAALTLGVLHLAVHQFNRPASPARKHRIIERLHPSGVIVVADSERRFLEGKCDGNTYRACFFTVPGLSTIPAFAAVFNSECKQS